VNLDSPQQDGTQYNLLRHAGVIYALGAAYEYSPDTLIKNTMVRSSEFLKRYAVRSIPEQPELLAVWSDPVVTGSGKKLPEIKLGGCGLGLAAFCSLKKVDEDAVSLSFLQKLGGGILFMQKPNGGFYSKYTLHSGLDDSWVSLYYPGEAVLGLIMLYELDGDQRWLISAMNGLSYLARSRRNDSKVLPDHWALIATRKLFEQNHLPVGADRQDLLFHAEQICRSIMDDQVIEGLSEKTNGGFDIFGRTCPAATRLEGLLAALRFLPQDSFYSEVERSVKDGIHFLLDAQVKTGPYAGAVPRASCKFESPDTENQKNHNERAGEIRIDYVQHALCAWIACSDYLSRSCTNVLYDEEQNVRRAK
jgi:hypothetical protein